MTRLAVALITLWLGVMPQIAAAQSCRLALVLGLDVSLSVNTFDFDLQRGGLAGALTDDAVADAILGTPGHHIELAVFEWSGQYNQNLLLDWTIVETRQQLDRIARTLRSEPQGLRSGRTAIGAAMLYARDKLHERPHCASWTLDISGDGPNNNGTAPEDLRAEMHAAGIIVNGLVIEPEQPPQEASYEGSLSDYFRANVIVGPASFVQTITGFEAYQEAITRKLLRELLPAIAQDTPALRPGSKVDIAPYRPRPRG